MQKNLTARAAPLLFGLAICGFAAAGYAASASGEPMAALALGLGAACVVALIVETLARRRQAARFEDAAMRLASGIERTDAHLAAIDDRLRDIEQWIARERPGVEQSAIEIEMLGSLVKELAVAVAGHDAELGAFSGQEAPPGAAPKPASPPAETASGPENRRGGVALDRAIADGAFDLHLQPIVSLPQRRVKFYEVFVRLRAADGELIAHDHGLALARAAGRAAALDVTALRKTAAAARRLAARNRDIAVFLSVSEEAATAPEALISALQGVQDLAGHVIVSLSQSTARRLGSAGLKHLKPIVDLGFALSLEDVADLRLDARMLFDHGVRYVKAPASILLAHANRAPTEIHPQDLAKHLARNGIQLIAGGIDLEKTAIEALDLDIRFGQGAAFSVPRPLRPDLGETSPEPVTPSEPAANDAPPARAPYRSTLRRA